MSISMKRYLVTCSHESHHPISENMKGLYKSDNFSNAITFGVSLFVFSDLNTHFEL